MGLPERIRTGRLVLRPLAPEDAGAVERGIGSWEVARMLTGVPHPYPRDGFADFLARSAREAEAGRRVYAIEAGRDLVGCIGLAPLDDRILELGYWVLPEASGQGYATEAAAAAVGAAMEAGAACLTAHRLVDNAASARVLAKLGFVETGREARWSEALRRRVACAVHLLTREAWLDSGLAGPNIVRAPIPPGNGGRTDPEAS